MCVCVFCYRIYSFWCNKDIYIYNSELSNFALNFETFSYFSEFKLEVLNTLSFIFSVKVHL